MDTTRQRYERLKKKVVERRTSFERLMHYLEKETEWLRASASNRFHLSKEGGLLEHTCNVAETMLKLKETLAPGII